MRNERKYRFDASRQFPLSLLEQIRLDRLCEVATRLDMRLAIPATSSNFSLRRSTDSFLVSRSGKHKRSLNAGDFLLVNLEGAATASVAPKPSDETLLHALIYRQCPWIQCVLHCHAPELEKVKGELLQFEGHELLKALGAPDHLTPLSVAVYQNDQDMKALAKTVEARQFRKNKNVSGPVLFVLAQHGIYCGGESIERAEAYLESVLHLLKNVGFSGVQS